MSIFDKAKCPYCGSDEVEHYETRIEEVLEDGTGNHESTWDCEACDETFRFAFEFKWQPVDTTISNYKV
jgi:uncharacterized protein with PIN domain